MANRKSTNNSGEKTRRTGERKFITGLQKWLHHYCDWSGPIECKYSYAKSFPYKSGFKPHQLPNLINAERACVTYKISDVASAAGFGCNPWDLDVYYKATSYVAIQWVGDKEFFLIRPQLILNEIKAGKKSLTKDRARVISAVIGNLK
jgi:hypothetical protein